jgi:hypothetical protein
MSDELKAAVLPSPGSDEALKAGCICAVIDNAHGRGYMGQAGVFVYTVGCPVHDSPSPSVAPDAKSGRTEE